MSHLSKGNNLVGVEGYVVYCPLLGKTQEARYCYLPGGFCSISPMPGTDTCQYFGGLDRESWKDENGEAMVAIRCNYEHRITGGLNMAVEASYVNEIVDKLLDECGFTTTLHCEKGDQHWDQKLGPSLTIRAIITGFVYLGEVVDKRLATLIQAVKGEVR